MAVSLTIDECKNPTAYILDGIVLTDVISCEVIEEGPSHDVLDLKIKVESIRTVSPSIPGEILMTGTVCRYNGEGWPEDVVRCTPLKVNRDERPRRKRFCLWLGLTGKRR